MGDAHQLATLVAFFHLTVDQTRCDLPLTHYPASTTSYEPVPEMGRQRIEIEIEPVTREEREVARGQDPSQRVDHGMSCVLRARTQMQHRHNLGTGVDDQPQPQDVTVATQPRPQLVQLEIGKLEVTEHVLVQAFSVPACTSEPGGDRRLTIAEDAFGRGSVQPFGQGRQHHGNLMRRGFQMVQRRITSRAERDVAGLAAEGLDPLSLPMLAIPDEGVDVSLGIPEVLALLVGTGVPFGVDSLGGSSPAFDLAPGPHRLRF